MSALSAGRVTKEWAPQSVVRSYKQATSSQIWNGGVVVATVSGYAVAATSGTLTSGTGFVVLGVAQMSQLTTSVNSYIPVHAGYFNLAADSAFAVTAIGNTCYLVDDQTVSMTSTNRSPAGTVAAVDADGNPWVKLGI